MAPMKMGAEDESGGSTLKPTVTLDEAEIDASLSTKGTTSSKTKTGVIPTTEPSHPLAPLTAQEIATVAAAVKRALVASEGDETTTKKSLRFESIELLEPSKEEISTTKEVERTAVCNAYKAGQLGVYRCVVSVTHEKVVSSKFLENAAPMISLEEFDEIEQAVKNDERFQRALKLRGLTDMSLVCVDPWSSAGEWASIGQEKDRHISHTFAWCRTSEFDNLYAHPIEGVCAVVDIKTLEVLRVDDHGVVDVPMQESNFDRTFQKVIRDDLKPIIVSQPEGVSFSLKGHDLKWHEWSMTVGFSAREGLVLHAISYANRPILHRMSLAEMVVPYGVPHGGHYRKNVFDIGEYGLGKLANSLELGCDCLGSIAYLDATVCDYNGQPYTIKNAICIHEEDDGILWKHFDFRTERTEVRRGRKLIVSSISTVGNYEYALYYYFYLDGTIELEVKATGIINTSACIPGEPSKYAAEVSQGVQGHIHQHVFCAKLDWAVDGNLNKVLECDTIAEPAASQQNPHGNAFYVKETPIEIEGPRDTDFSKARYWKFASSTKTNAVGQPTAYKLEPTFTVPPFVSAFSQSGKRAAFARHALWVTPFDAHERYPAGEYMNRADGISDGLPKYVAQARSVQDVDLVAWYSFGLHHLPRPEDFPVQPCIKAGFKLVPSGFFDRNPCLDLPYDTLHSTRLTPPTDTEEQQNGSGCCHQD